MTRKDWIDAIGSDLAEASVLLAQLRFRETFSVDVMTRLATAIKSAALSANEILEESWADRMSEATEEVLPAGRTTHAGGRCS